MSDPNRSCRRGFTLVELLFVVLLMGTVITVIMACFEGGFRVYDRVSTFGTGEMEAYLAGETVARDLKNAIQTPACAFAGDSQSMEMLTVMSGSQPLSRCSAVRYASEGSGLIRLMATSVNPDTEEWGESDRLLGSGFAVRFRYKGNPDSQGGGDDWSDTWAGHSNLPVAVEFQVSGAALPEGPIQRVVLIETAGVEDQP